MYVRSLHPSFCGTNTRILYISIGTFHENTYSFTLLHDDSLQGSAIGLDGAIYKGNSSLNGSGVPVGILHGASQGQRALNRGQHHGGNVFGRDDGLYFAGCQGLFHRFWKKLYYRVAVSNLL